MVAGRATAAPGTYGVTVTVTSENTGLMREAITDSGSNRATTTAMANLAEAIQGLHSVTMTVRSLDRTLDRHRGRRPRDRGRSSAR